MPDDDAELLAELRRHGVRLHLVVSAQGSTVDRSPNKQPEFFSSLSAAPDLG